MSKEKEMDFVRELKSLCKKWNVGELSAHFNQLIEDHSVTHTMIYEYRSPTQNKGIESSTLYLKKVENI